MRWQERCPTLVGDVNASDLVTHLFKTGSKLVGHTAERLPSSVLCVDTRTYLKLEYPAIILIIRNRSIIKSWLFGNEKRNLNLYLWG